MKTAAAVRVSLIAATALVAGLAASVFEDVRTGAPPSIPIPSVTARCSTEDPHGPCVARVIRLNEGRFYVRTMRPASSITLEVADSPANARTGVLLVRSPRAGWLIVERPPGIDAVNRVDALIDRLGVRSTFELPPGGRWNQVTFVLPDSTSPVVFDEIGFFETSAGLLKPFREPFPRIDPYRFYATYVVLLTFAVCAFFVFAAYLLPSTMRAIGPWVAAVLCFSICMLEIGTNYSPYWKYDLRSFYAAETIESGFDGNLTGGLFSGVRLVEGQGLTVGDRNVQWHRMPGYGLFCALATVIGRTTDVIALAPIVVILQVALYAASVGVFVWVAPRIFSVGLSCLLGVLLMLLPKQLFYTQADSIVAPIAMLVLSTLIVYLAETKPGAPPRLRTYLLLNGTLALWFLMRTDVLPGWFVLAAVLARPRLRYVVVPLVLATTLAVVWGVYKRPYRHEFNLMPTNTGEVLFLSLCEVPGRFEHPCTDAGYFTWISGVTRGDPTSQRANNVAIAEVFRYWATYPVHFGVMVWTKMARSIQEQFWSGVITRFNTLFRLLRDGRVVVYLVGLVLIAMAVGHERRRTFLLGWALFLNMPLFYVVWASGGRFYSPAGVSLLAAAVPLLVEPAFYRQAGRYTVRTAAIALGVAIYALVADRAPERVIADNSIHYWAPLLDPRESTIAVKRAIPRPGEP